MPGPKRIYWDTCCFISLIKNEPRTEEEQAGLLSAQRAFERKEIILVTSALTITELTETKISADGLRRVQSFFKRSDVSNPVVDVGIAEKARQIRDYFNAEYETPDAVTPPDAIHLATAIISGCTQFHTFDEHSKRKRPGLIQLSGSAGVDNLIICKPNAPQYEADV